MKHSTVFCMILLMSGTFLLANDEYSNGFNTFEYNRIGRFSSEDFFDVTCVDNIIASAPIAIKRIILNLLYPPKNKAALPKRLLLVGKPGTGKTTLAKAIAIKSGYDYYVIEAPFLLNEYKNSGPQNLLREISPLLHEGRPVVVIIDEITELTDRYKKENDSDATVACALWILLDTCAQFDNVFFIGTSNKEKKDLPKQLQSRFDEDIITIDLPNNSARRRILQHYLKNEQHALDERFVDYLVYKTGGRSVREIEKLILKAIQYANVRIPYRYTINAKDFEKALKLWKPFWHPAIVYEKIEPHIQPFFKTAFPIILQTLGLVHAIYSAERQQHNVEQGLLLQKLSYDLQKSGHALQQDGLACQQDSVAFQKDSFAFQKKMQEKSYKLQKKGLRLQERGSEMQEKALGLQEEGSGMQSKALELQREAAKLQEDSKKSQEMGTMIQKYALFWTIVSSIFGGIPALAGVVTLLMLE